MCVDKQVDTARERQLKWTHEYECKYILPHKNAHC